MDLVAAAQILSSFGTLSLAGLAFRQVREIKQARLAQERPQVIVDADYSRRGLVDVVIRNIGKGAAKNITFEFSSPMVSSMSEQENSLITPVNEYAFFKDGIDYLAPGAEIRTVWDGYLRLRPLLITRGLQYGITITSHYESLSGGRHSSAWTVNPLRMAMVAEPGKGVSELVEVAEKFQKDFHRATRDSNGAIRVLTQTKKERDRHVAEAAEKSGEWIERLKKQQKEGNNE